MMGAGVEPVSPRRLLVAVVAIEFGRIMRPRGSMPAFLLAALPVGIAFAVGAFGDGAGRSIGFYNLLVGASVFFGCAFIFTKLFRGEILERTLHYYLLAPMRREVLLLGKYAAGVAASWSLFGTATVLSYALLLGLGDARAAAHWIPVLLSNVSGTLLACVGYGSLFLLFGLLFRNPILPVGALLAWEGLHFLLPPWLQMVSVRHYVGALTSAPSPLPESPIVIVATTPAPWVAVPSLIALAALALALGAWRLRRLEIRYTEA